MGAYLFNTDVLVEMLRGEEHDFGKSVIPQAAQRFRMVCYPFDGYWEDVGTIEAFYRANMAWREGRGIAEHFRSGSSIITHARQLPPSRIDGTSVSNSIIADGCDIRARRVVNSIIGVRARIGDDCVVEDAIIMGNDSDRGTVPFEIGPGCHIRRAIIDKNAVVGVHSTIGGGQSVADADNELYSVRSGIVVVPRGVALPAGTVV
jgi:glucose-1-phosphate adenylyltransferase